MESRRTPPGKRPYWKRSVRPVVSVTSDTRCSASYAKVIVLPLRSTMRRTGSGTGEPGGALGSPSVTSRPGACRPRRKKSGSVTEMRERSARTERLGSAKLG